MSGQRTPPGETRHEVAEYIRTLVDDAPPLPDCVVKLLVAARVREVADHDVAA